MLAKMSDAWKSQSQRVRWVKAGAIVFAFICLIYWFSPAGVQVYHEGLLIALYCSLVRQ